VLCLVCWPGSGSASGLGNEATGNEAKEVLSSKRNSERKRERERESGVGCYFKI